MEMEGSSQGSCGAWMQATVASVGFRSGANWHSHCYLLLKHMGEVEDVESQVHVLA